MINTGGGRQVAALDVRSCDRTLWNDCDAAAWLWDRVRPYVPEILRLYRCDVMGYTGVRAYGGTPLGGWKATRHGPG